ncbi:hypothetical protein VNO78_16022 [Psophocarpus tetragonolobus]|uniref:Uncharacterized protein n=1 Tax=Psophocarpus tetragonolobus TaxID=3891 RepID=A0AAN9SF22_PSOTE
MRRIGNHQPHTKAVTGLGRKRLDIHGCVAVPTEPVNEGLPLGIRYDLQTLLLTATTRGWIGVGQGG